VAFVAQSATSPAFILRFIHRDGARLRGVSARGRQRAHMPRPARRSRDAVLAAASVQYGLLTAAQLTALGVQRSTLSRSDHLGGMFSRVLHGVHRVDGRGALSPDQRDMAALLYGGAECLLTGSPLLVRKRVKAARHPALHVPGNVHVLVPHSHRPAA
jgi:hypothetical protein